MNYIALKLQFNDVIQSLNKPPELKATDITQHLCTKKGGIAPTLSDRNSAEAYLISPIERLRYSTFITTPGWICRPIGAALG